MPIIKSAKKAARQAEKRTAHNQQIKKDIKTALKAFKASPTTETMAKIHSLKVNECEKQSIMNRFIRSILEKRLKRFINLILIRGTMELMGLHKLSIKHLKCKVRCHVLLILLHLQNLKNKDEKTRRKRIATSVKFTSSYA